MKKLISILAIISLITSFSFAQKKSDGLDTVSAKFGNTVSGNQMTKKSQFVFFEGNGTQGGLLCVGHSLTKHAPLKSIGWEFDWGMAATAKEKDYVHVLWKLMKQKYGDMPLCIAKAGYFERNFPQADKILPQRYTPARDFKAKWIVISIVDNVRPKMAKEHSFIKEYEKLVDFVNPDGKAKIIITTAWYPLKALNKDLIEFAKRRNITIVDIGKIYHQEGMKATGLWKHAGVASHPSDKGMKALAEAYFQALTQQK
jgi:hypothetical protein